MSEFERLEAHRQTLVAAQARTDTTIPDLPDLLTVILLNLDDATHLGHPDAVRHLTGAVALLGRQLDPLMELLSHPENRVQITLTAKRLRGFGMDDLAPSVFEAVLALVGGDQ